MNKKYNRLIQISTLINRSFLCGSLFHAAIYFFAVLGDNKKGDSLKNQKKGRGTARSVNFPLTSSDILYRMTIIMKMAKIYLSGIAIGFINALFGAGGGMIAVPLLRSMGLGQKQAQATAISVILPLSVITCFVYLKRGYVSFSDALPFLPFGVIGAVFGTKLLKKINNSLLKKIFAVFMLWAGIRMVMK